jgi:methylmalonyl-CoA mutase C-terminal domain/subunit
VDAIGLSVLSGAHNYLFGWVLELLREKGSTTCSSSGRHRPPDDIARLKAEGCANLRRHVHEGHRRL